LATLLPKPPRLQRNNDGGRSRLLAVDIAHRGLHNSASGLYSELA
jgi:hypothetical protein